MCHPIDTCSIFVTMHLTTEIYEYTKETRQLSKQ